MKTRESEIWPADFKKLIANASAAYVIYQNIGGQVVPIAATNLLAEMMLGPGSTADEYLNVVGTPAAFGQVDEVDRPRFLDKVNEFRQNGGLLDVIYRRKLFGSDTYHVVRARGQIKHLDDGTGYAVIYFEDVNAQKESTYTSSVTELPDMSYLLTFGGVEARRILAQGGTPTLAYFDIKGMKAYNAAFGFEAGNRLLKQVGRGLEESYPGRTVCHVSDDHFTLIGDLDEIQTKLVEGRVDHLVSRIGENIATTLKCGYAPIKDEGDVAAACDRARTACESISDDASRRYVKYSPEMGRADKLARYVRQTFDDALEKGWVQPYFQPIVRTLTGETCGFEALARWTDPVYGPIPPDVFVPALEGAQLIQKLDAYIIRRVCEEAMEWFRQGKPCAPISVNLSRLDFLKEDVFEEIERVVSACDVPRDYLNIEITESVMRYGSEVKTAVERFHQAGYQVWMDDFGSGYSSLNVLKDFPFDEIKIDMMFLHPFTDVSRKIVASIVHMAKKIGIHTLAEGVETAEQVSFLKEIGCE
ncbi:MAG: EAL domain-containing protein, partial [Coriobacteriales bacterium]